MKKILTFALCLTAVGTMSAQKEAVDQAAKLSGKIDKVAEARSLIKQASEDPATANDVRTYFVGGKVEYDAYDEAYKKRAINPNDESVNLVDMGNQLINGYNMFMKALPLDSVPDEKGKVKAKHSKDMIGRINGHYNDYYNMAGELFNNKHYYPEAYNAFMIYGDLPTKAFADKNVKATPDTTRALAYYYAGIGAYSGNALQDALVAFEKARKAGITEPQNYVYEIACWQNLSKNDSTLEEQAKKEIENVARYGYEQYGISNPLFINNLVNSMILSDRNEEALALVNDAIAKNDVPFLYGLRAYINDRKGDEAASLADYRKAASFDNADVETLKNAAKKIYTAGTVQLDKIDRANPEARNQVKAEYFEQAKALVDRARTLAPGDGDLDYILDSIQYALDTFF